jgi:hypothetical protein
MKVIPNDYYALICGKMAKWDMIKKTNCIHGFFFSVSRNVTKRSMKSMSV